MNKVIFEIEGENENQKIKVMKYYLLDWDDNVMFMPTKIYVLDEDGTEVGMSTEDFSHFRNLIDKETGKTKKPFEYEGYNIVSLAPNAFRDFRSGLSEFVQDMNAGTFGPSWNDLVEAINTGSYFAIITARGHKPKVFKDAVKILIEKSIGGISKDKLIQSLKKRKEKAGEEYTNDDEEIENYLNMCVFYPVSHYHTSGGVEPEAIKRDVIVKFTKDIKSLVNDLNERMKSKGQNEYKLVPKFGFSDDDLKNVDYSKQIKGINVYSTHGGIKKKVKDDEDNLKESLTRFKQLLK